MNEWIKIELNGWIKEEINQLTYIRLFQWMNKSMNE